MSYTFIGIYTFLRILFFVESKVPDVHVTCIYSKDCILPCSFTSTDDEVVIQWYQQGELIYSFQKGEDEPDNSDMSLFTDAVSQGNASLLLEDSTIRSRGRYKCMVNTTQTVQESFVIVKVEALISRISIEASSSEYIQCSSYGIYPAPLLTWSTEPRLSPGAPHSTTKIAPDSNGLYSIESAVRKVNSSSHATYTCTITSKYRSQVWTASLLQKEMTGKNGQYLVVPCTAPKNLKNFTLTWTFTRQGKHEEIITYYSENKNLVNHWDKHAELDWHKVSMGDWSLHIEHLEGSTQSGTYTCTFSGSQAKHIVQTRVNVSASRVAPSNGKGNRKLWILAVVVAVLVLLCVSLYMFKKYTGKSKNSDQGHQRDTEMQAMHNEDVPAENTPLSEHTKADS
ncbi:HERV-H LTR-associating protein 2 [Brachyhypopomus gauderio]|uniref:HERV-H LTR-associating protein 2 n=1 Tax=Brachyhypopomus gauderio TaxID=698409 RepID=UPI004043060B